MKMNLGFSVSEIFLWCIFVAGILGFIYNKVQEGFYNIFRINNKFFWNSPNLLTCDYRGGSCRMHNLVIKAKDASNKSFKVQIGYEMDRMEKFNFYGFAESHGTGKVVIRTFLGRGPCKFLILFDKPKSGFEVTIDSRNFDKPDVIYPPQIWQRLDCLWEKIRRK